MAFSLQRRHPVNLFPNSDGGRDLTAKESYGFDSYQHILEEKKLSPFKDRIIDAKKLRGGYNYLEFTEILVCARNQIQYVSLCNYLAVVLCEEAQKKSPIDAGDYSRLVSFARKSIKQYETKYSMRTFDIAAMVEDSAKSADLSRVFQKTDAAQAGRFFRSIESMRKILWEHYITEFHCANAKKDGASLNKAQSYHVLQYASDFVDYFFNRIYKEI